MVPDTFRNQTILWVCIGAALLVLGVIKAGTGSGEGAGPFIGFGGACILVFGVARPVLRRTWLRAVRTGTTEARAGAVGLLSGPAGGFWRIGMHLDVDGRDRDGKF